MVGYCAFYGSAPGVPALEQLSRALIADPDRQGVQFVARTRETGAAIGFATVFWTWQTTTASRIGVMNDLFVAPDARGGGAAQALIEACAQRAREHGATELTWITALDNGRAQTVYDRTGAERESWITYALALTPG
jgi:GNAT superfamily N-acetyltransferase